MDEPDYPKVETELGTLEFDVAEEDDPSTKKEIASPKKQSKLSQNLAELLESENASLQALPRLDQYGIGFTKAEPGMLGNEQQQGTGYIDEKECKKIIAILKSCMGIKDNIDYLKSEDIRRLFLVFDRVFKATKMQLSDVLSKGLYHMLLIANRIRHISSQSKSQGKDIMGTETFGIEKPIPLNKENVNFKLRSSHVVKWDNVKLERLIHGIKVLFHYPTISKPQLQILSKLIYALKTNGHAVLESPTGTGKTAAIISGVLSWLYQSQITNTEDESANSEPKYKVIYLTRTHAQIKQISTTIDQSCFRPQSCTLASRKILCPYYKSFSGEVESGINNQNLNDLDNYGITNKCRALLSSTNKLRLRRRKNKTTCSGRDSIFGENTVSKICPYYANMGCKSYSISTAVRFLTDLKATWDIEDTYGFCHTSNPDFNIGCNCRNPTVKKKRSKPNDISKYFEKKAAITGNEIGCPYYTAKAVSQVANFVICPYQYIIDPHIVVKSHAIVSKVLTLLEISAEYNYCKDEILEVIYDRINYLNRSIGGGEANGFFGSLDNAILIFDEGHNVENSCLEEGSTDIYLSTLDSILNWFFELKTQIEKNELKTLEPNSSNIDYYTTKAKMSLLSSLSRITSFLRAFIDKLNEFVSNHSERKYMKMNENSKETPERKIYKETPERKIYKNENGNPDDSSTSQDTVFKLFHSWDRYDEDDEDGTLDFILLLNLSLLKVYVVYCSMLQISSYGKWLDLAGIHFSAEYRKRAEIFFSILILLCYSPQSYNVCITRNTKNDKLRLNLWLLNPSLIFNEIATHAYSIIIASGTLTPIQALVNSLGPAFATRLNNNILSATQVLSPDQFMVFILTHIPHNEKIKRLECNFKESRDDQFVATVGNTIATLMHSLPGRTILFFPNRNLIVRCLSVWSKNAFEDGKGYKGSPIMIIDKITELKMNIYQETNNASQFTEMLERIKRDDTCLILAVFRSHFSEGINLNLSSILLLGLPFPSIISPQVDVSRRYHKTINNKCFNINYNWYLRETFRAVNQAIGRCIRNKDDRGIVLLLDNRYTLNLQYISSWLHPYTFVYNNANKIVDYVDSNFKFFP
ncbi:hypothetical protein BEWA_020580 [Theileria equi strain WA]|uniref:Helicase ATP-binding domain-containing protein n=1 Tax=Theileria equi strain WA TaxID=1537102 RepID=L0AVZ9_THEEQ|nr:hypothetical protein BEWA_020580 [Theileria equi strain WA]AFZ79211.1 hypothetical protein BEWA_020580 [Theileria equi strain WA]|eukprot:XP_004828877.1 hypothetical protein BEWA_020580 [Theileria equi strain WA]